MNIFEALRESHVIQRNLAERLLQTSGDTPERRELFERLKNELFAHAVAEDRYFYIPFSVHDKFHRTLILSGFCLLKIAKISLNSSFFPKPIKR